ncbi:FecCD family ABC transporter permease [Halobacillus mangrovi]|uniref:Iron-dicitrate transporter subunit FecD n=1 Tax=Halobacillus mangrovi TaxID=402384 RepID=A0A1W5ZY58_9BACI|nr:iron ABC transporter permease [Halobacillus mangrovi]ARI78194.1 iron-dicitrate transporter subunit FecD [Halobacillus mangrovi]
MKKENKIPLLWIMGLAILVFVGAFISIGVGAVYISPSAIVTYFQGSNPEGQAFIIENFRMPRIVMALLVGAGLGVSGAILQGIIRNPLASPDVIGITKGAGLAAAATIILWDDSPVIALPIAAFIGAGAVTVALYIFAYRQGVKPATLALVGIALGAICQAGIQLLTVKFPVETNAALVWLTGSMWGKDWTDVLLLLPWILLLFPLALLLSPKLDVLNLGDDVAEGLGEPVKRARALLLVVAVILAAASVAVVGTLGFVGLVAPHIARQLVGNRHYFLIPASALTGMALLLLADGLGRGLLPPTEVPAGIFTAVIGAPYFLYLLRKMSVTK